MVLFIMLHIGFALRNAAATSAHEFNIIKGSSLTSSFSTVGSVTKLHCTYLCVRQDACSGVSHNTLTNECRLSYVSIDVVDAHVQTDANSSVYVKKTPEVRYLGCFKDKYNQRALGTFLWTGRSWNTPKICLAACVQRGYIFSGVQWSSECYCGNSHQSAGAAPESECFYTCSGNSSIKCGGDYRNSVYVYG